MTKNKISIPVPPQECEVQWPITHVMYSALFEASTSIDVALDMLDFSDRPATKKMLQGTLNKVNDALNAFDAQMKALP